VTALVAALIALHGARLALHIDPEAFAFTADDLAAHRWLGLITYQFVHVGWLHVVFNAASTLAFGAPVARLMGQGARGAIAYLLFFLVCGIAAAIGFVPVAGSSNWALIGASGAASGLLGGAARIMEGRGRLGSMVGGTVVSIGVSWLIINVVFGLSGLSRGAGGGPVAWQAHIVGFLAGVVLIGPCTWLAGPGKGDHALAP
jgi:membrane associated rhomboid family serine protease